MNTRPYKISRFTLTKLSALLLLGFLAAVSALADTVYVTATTSNCASSTVCGQGPNPDFNSLGLLVYTDNGYGAFTSAKAGASGKPATPGSRFCSNSFSNSTPDLGVAIAPTLGVPGGVYQIHHAFSSAAGNVSSDILLGVTNVDGCTLSFTNTDKFQSSFGGGSGSTWQLLGFVTNNPGVSNPVITFYFLGGTVSAGAQKRLLFDTFRFILYAPCLDVANVGVTGPISTNSPTVAVTGVTNAAAVSVYQDSGSGMVRVGQLTSGIVNGNNNVPVSGLVPGAKIAATQTVGSQEGCVPPTGFVVGTGPNPAIRVALSVRENIDLTGPAGSPGPGTNVNIYYIGASSLLPGAAPEQGVVINPSNGWQTITFNRGVDPLNPVNPVVLWNNGASGDTTLDGNYGVLDGLAFAAAGDSGPFDIYLDNMSNGTNGVLQNWEAAAVGANSYQFRSPNFSGTTIGNILPDPSQAQVTSAAAFSGTKAVLLKFQFNSAESNKWVRIVTAGTTGANPQIDLNEPITFKVLLLPPGVSPISPVPSNLSIMRSGGSVTLNWSGSYQLQIAPAVTGPYTDVSGITTGPYTIPATAPETYYRLRNQVN